MTEALTVHSAGIFELLKPPYKSNNNMWYTGGLFWEVMKDRPKSLWHIEPIFTLYEDRPGYTCFRTTFVALNDTTGYKWAMQYLGDWEHWLLLMKKSWFRTAYEHALRELYTKLRSEGVDKIRELATSPDVKSSLPAAKYLAELERNLEKRTAGRPSREEVAAELKVAKEARMVEDEDMERIGLTVINGGRT